MFEVEVKVPADVDEVRDRLLALGADRIGAVTQRDRYFDHPARSFASTDEALRIRREDAAATMTYKGPRIGGPSKTREEREVAIDDADTAVAILESLGFETAGRVTKDRERYDLDGYTVTLDRVERLGEFVEVEARGEPDAIEELEAGATALLERLDLSPDDRVSTSYLELLMAS